jgi:hypothetical protein
VACVQVLETREVLSPPTVPGTPVLTGLGATSATISWGASTDNVALTGYSVYWIYTTGHSGRGGGITTHTILEATTNGSTTTATITGLTQNQTYTLYVKATDVAGYSSAYSRPVTVTPGAAPANFTATEVGSGPNYAISVVANHQLSVQLSATSFPAITYSVVSPPSGMTVDPTSGLVTWTPGAGNVGTTNVTFQATNMFGTTARTVPITVSPDVPVPGFVFTNTGSPTMSVVGFPIGLTITDASNTPSTYSIVSGPASASINPTSGVVNWVPTADQVPGQTFVFQLVNSAGSATISVSPVVYISDAPQNVAVTGADTESPTVTWSPPVYNDSLVAGYRLMISGPGFFNDNFTTDASTFSASFPAAGGAGTYYVNIQAIDANGNQGLWSSLAVNVVPNVPNPTYAFTSNGGLPDAIAGTLTTIQVTDQNTSLPSTFALLSGPSGMTLDPNTGLVTWAATLDDLSLGEVDPQVAVTNSSGTTYLTIPVPVVFCGPVGNVTATRNAGAGTVTLGWTPPTITSEPVAGYDVSVTWIGDEGNVGSAGGVAPAGATSFTLAVPSGVSSYTVYIIPVDANGNYGAYDPNGKTFGGG